MSPSPRRERNPIIETMPHPPAIQSLIALYLATPEAPGLNPDDFIVDTFGDSPAMADALLALVLDGTKTATCSALWAWEHDHQTPPAPGLHAVILDGSGSPRCILETTEIEITEYQRVTPDFARAEGEHTPLDLPDPEVLAHWRQGHQAFFERTLPQIGRAFAPDMPVVCERFRVVYQEP